MSSSCKVIGCISEGLNKGDFDWMISICTYNILETFNPVKSPTFSFASSAWYVEMKHYKPSRDDCISLYLFKEDFKSKKYVSFSFEMIFLGLEVKKEGGSVYFSEDVKSWGWKNYISRKKLLDHSTEESKSCGQLIIRIKLRDYVLHEEDAILKVRSKGKEILNQNYKDLLRHGKDHDLVLKIKDKEFKAHRNILQSRCPVFQSMLTHEMLEKNSGVVVIPDCDPSAFEQFLLYIYTGELHILDESNMLGLYFVADKYDMENLREECCAFIKKSLSVHVVCDVIKLAQDHFDMELLEFATNFFANNGKEILSTEEWMSFNIENPGQATELLINVFDKISYCCVHRSTDVASNLE